MLWNVQNHVIHLPEGEMPCAVFGRGSRTLVLLPGLGDGLKSTRGMALPLAWMYRAFAKDFTVWAFDRKSPMPAGYTTRDMANDQALAMVKLGIGRADVVGVSMGGMIAQWLAADHPERVERLVLTVTCPRPNPILEESVAEWVELARQGDHTALMDSNVRRIYTEDYYRKNKWMIPVTGKLTKPKSYERFFVQAEACLHHDAYDRLPFISVPTLVVGGEKDQSLGGDASREIAARIPGAKLRMYLEYGHGVYEEAKDFHKALLRFLG